MKLSPPLKAHDIARSHRLVAPREGGRPRPIIVLFVSDKARDAVYRARSGLKVYNSQNREAPVFVNDDLTNRRAKLAFDCRKLKKEKKIADTWTYNGKVVMKDLTGKISEVGRLPYSSCSAAQCWDWLRIVRDATIINATAGNHLVFAAGNVYHVIIKTLLFKFMLIYFSRFVLLV